MRVVTGIAFVTLTWVSAWSQGPAVALQHLTGQPMLLLHATDRAKIKVKKAQLTRMKGGCDAAVLVKSAAWNDGTLRLKIQYIGRPLVANQPHRTCMLVQDDMLLEISGFAPDEAADFLMESVHQVLKTPEEFLAYNIIPFSFLPGPDEEVTAKPPPPITHPTPLLIVDPAFTREARAAHRKGVVKLRFTVGTDGRAHKPKVISSPGFGLDASALRVLPLWRFAPARQGDKYIASESMVEMNFDLL